MKTLTLGYSPCPNDTFIFYALVHGKIDTGDLQFREILEDVESLNRMARNSELDMTKVSFHAFGYLREDYCLLRAGGALGKGCGPLLVAKNNCRIQDLRGRKIAIPGSLTTAFLLLQLYEPEFRNNIKVLPFNQIIDAVKNGDADAGLIIHESRFTYQTAGLKKIIDLGEWWEETTGLPIPLGGIIARRELGREIVKKIDKCLRLSIEYAFSNRLEPRTYIKQYSQELDDEVINKHIDLYVNQFSLDLGDNGMHAVEELFRQAESKGLLEKSSRKLMEQPE